MAKNSLEDKLDEHSTHLEEEMENNLKVVKEQITTVEQNIKEQMSTVEQNFQRQVQTLEERIALLEIGKVDIAEAKTAWPLCFGSSGLLLQHFGNLFSVRKDDSVFRFRSAM